MYINHIPLSQFGGKLRANYTVSGSSVTADYYKPRDGHAFISVSYTHLVASCAGAGGETIKVTGNLNNVGTFVDGEFNTTTKTFTEAGAAESV